MKNSNRNMYQRFVEMIGPDYVFFSRHIDGTVTYINPHVKEIIGISADTIIGKKWYEVFNMTDETIEIGNQSNIEMIAGEISPPFIMEFFDAFQNKKSFEIQQRPIFNNNNEVIGVDGIAKDITQQKLMEEEMESSLKEKEILLSEIHHRVKNNMQIIISLLKLQAGKSDNKQHVDMFTEIENRIRSMAIVHETLYLSKNFANIDFNGYVKTISNHLLRSFAVIPDKIKLKREIENIPLKLDNAIPCGLIINELVSNALKYAFPEEGEGEIKITLRSINDDQIELTVSDNGIGIPAEIDMEKTESLGLQLVQLLAENQLDGTLELDRDGGTAFRIRFER